MARERFIEILRCPYCGGAFEVDWRRPEVGTEIEFGVLRCQCYRYGIVAGTIVIRQFSPVHNAEDPIVTQLDLHAYENAVRLLFELTQSRRVSRWRRTFTSLTTTMQSIADSTRAPYVIRPSDTLLGALRRLRPRHYADYLYYRHANPSLQTALPILAAMAVQTDVTRNNESEDESGKPGEIWSLDLGCGIGHTAYAFQSLLPHSNIVAADVDPINLLLARNFLAPLANFICCDAEAGLPFRDNVFDTTFSLDCVHYIRGKLDLAKELRRVGRGEALYALAHLHNASVANPNPGIPLSADGYTRIFRDLGGQLCSEDLLLQTYSQTGDLALESANSPSELENAYAFVYLSLGNAMDQMSLRDLDQRIAGCAGRLGINPLYRLEVGPVSTKLRLHWPSKDLSEECRAGFQPLPEIVEVAPQYIDMVKGGRIEDLPGRLLESLIRASVIVPTPIGRALH